MLLSLWLSPSGKSGDLEVLRPYPLLSVKGIHPAVFTAQGFIAMRAGTSGADASAEQVALRAALLAEVAGFAGRALVDDDRAWRALWDRNDRRDRLACSPSRLPAGIRAEASSAGRVEAVAADRAGDRSVVVTRRGVRHGQPPSSRCLGL